MTKRTRCTKGLSLVVVMQGGGARPPSKTQARNVSMESRPSRDCGRVRNLLPPLGTPSVQAFDSATRGWTLFRHSSSVLRHSNRSRHGGAERDLDSYVC